MSGVLERARAHWRPMAEGSVHIPEWNITVHFRRFTVADQSTYATMLKSDPVFAGVRIVQTRALDDKGERLFDDEPGTTNALMHDVSPAVLERILTAISSVPNEKHAEKN